MRWNQGANTGSPGPGRALETSVSIENVHFLITGPISFTHSQCLQVFADGGQALCWALGMVTHRPYPNLTRAYGPVCYADNSKLFRLRGLRWRFLPALILQIRKEKPEERSELLLLHSSLRRCGGQVCPVRRSVSDTAPLTLQNIQHCLGTFLVVTTGEEGNCSTHYSAPDGRPAKNYLVSDAHSSEAEKAS